MRPVKMPIRRRSFSIAGVTASGLWSRKEIGNAQNNSCRRDLRRGWNAMIIAGWDFGTPEPKAAIATAEAAVAADLISPFEIMIRHGRNLPVEAWDAF